MPDSSSLPSRRMMVGLFLTLVVVLTPLAVALDLFDALYLWTRPYENWEIDEAISVLLAGLVSYALTSIWILIRQNRFLQAEIQYRKIYEQELMVSRSLRSLGVLTGGICHSLNNLIQPIISLSEETRDTLPADSPERENMDVVLDAALEARHLVRDILAFSRHQSFEAQDIPLKDVLDQTAKLIRSSVPSRIRLELLTRDVGMVRIDPSQLQTAVLNIVQNAVDAIPEHGTITISLATITRQHQPWARIRIEDTGGGMSEATMSRIFEPFFTTKGPREGTGLGMAVTYAIVTNHGGDITVSSAPRRGTTLDILLPVVNLLESET